MVENLITSCYEKCVLSLMYLLEQHQMNLHCQMESQRDINAILGNMIEKLSNKKSNYSGDIIVASTVSAMNV